MKIKEDVYSFNLSQSFYDYDLLNISDIKKRESSLPPSIPMLFLSYLKGRARENEL